MSEFVDKVVLVTGAGRGTGRSIAMAFSARGAVIAANDISPVNLDESVERMTSAGGMAKDYVFDIAKLMPVKAMLDQIMDDWGRIDVLVNSASVEPKAPILEMDEWDWRRTIDVNLSGPFFTMQSVGNIMRQQGGGVMINIASSPAHAHVLEDSSAYVASKMGLIGLTRAAAREFADHNIRVNAVCPSVIEAEMTVSQSQEQGRIRELLAGLSQERSGDVEGVVGLVLSLCSQAASDITGQVISVDGSKVIC
jgi:3-oxoacyl-[acyl-carrier protein] reductase